MQNSNDVNTLIFEVENIIGKPIIPVNIDKRILIYMFPLVFLFLLLIRPSFVRDRESEKISYRLLLVYTLLIGIMFSGCVYAYSYRRFF